MTSTVAHQLTVSIDTLLQYHMKLPFEHADKTLTLYLSDEVSLTKGTYKYGKAP